MKGDMAEKYMEQHHPELAEFDKCAVELRDHDLHRVARGDTRGLEHLKSWRMPEPRPRGIINEDEPAEV